jgi:DNA-binding response OmpR family regulator
MVLFQTFGSVRRKLVVLIAENHPALRAVVADCLAEAFPGCECILCGGAEAVGQATRSRSLDAIVLDIGLPGLDGIDRIPQIKAVAPGVPVVVITAHYEEFCRCVALAAGASDYIRKEAIHEKLPAALSRLLPCKGKLGQS